MRLALLPPFRYRTHNTKSEEHYGHTGLCVSVKGNAFVSCEGNSNSNGSNDGEAVVSNSRTMKDAKPGQPLYKFVSLEP